MTNVEYCWVRYTPPWPRGNMNGQHLVTAQPPLMNFRLNDQLTEKPYMKPLPKPPKPQKQQWINNQRHYSDDSLHSHQYNNQRVHSSADEISSLNHSPSLSSSDESYSKTTDASPSPSPPLLNVPDTKHYLFPSDIQVNPCSSPDTSPKASQDYIPPCCLANNNPPESIPSSRSFSPGKNGNNNSSRGSGRSSKQRDSPRHFKTGSSSSSRKTSSDKLASTDASNSDYRKRNKKNNSLEKSSIKSDSSKKDNSSQTDLKISTPESNAEQDFEKQIRKLLEEQTDLRGNGKAADKRSDMMTAGSQRYVQQQQAVANLLAIANQQQQSLGIVELQHLSMTSMWVRFIFGLVLFFFILYLIHNFIIIYRLF